MGKNAVGAYYDTQTGEYDDLYRRVVSVYPDLFWAAFYYLPKDFVPKSVLELGCGTGILTQELRNRWPSAELTIVDASSGMIDKTLSRVGNSKVTSIHSSFEKLGLDEGKYDLVISSLALHHIVDAEKPTLYKSIRKWLSPEGLFVLIDCVRSTPQRLYLLDHEHWNQLMIKNGVPEPGRSELNNHHTRFDNYISPKEILTMMDQAGFRESDILWRYCIWGVFLARC